MLYFTPGTMRGSSGSGVVPEKWRNARPMAVQIISGKTRTNITFMYQNRQIRKEESSRSNGSTISGPVTHWNHSHSAVIGSILNPLAGKCSEDTRKKCKGAKTGASHDWRSFYLSQYDWLKGGHMTKVVWLPKETDYSYGEFVAPNTPHSVVCDEHFEPSCFAEDKVNKMLGLPQKKRLHRNAVPTLFVHKKKKTDVLVAKRGFTKGWRKETRPKQARLVLRWTFSEVSVCVSGLINHILVLRGGRNRLPLLALLF